MSTHRIHSAGLRAAVALTAVLTVSGVALAGDGAQFGSFCDRTYVNKKVGENEVWAITWELFGDVTGNVLKLDGSAPSFIECILIDEDGTNATFDCYGSSACTGPPCGGSQWVPIATGRTLPISFFLPPGVSTDDPVESCVEEF